MIGQVRHINDVLAVFNKEVGLKLCIIGTYCVNHSLNLVLVPRYN